MNEKAAPLTRKPSKAIEPIPCGIVMPISQIGDCSEGHWSDVLSIITDAVSEVGFSANLVSNADEVTIIQKTIVQNLYHLPVVICDVSEKNPNVMFELGLRLAFDKPTIIIKDNMTSFSFDMGVVEHIDYPRDLRFSKIVEFKKKLGEKVLATYDKSQNDQNFSTFLKHFGEFKVSSIDETEISSQEYIMEQLAAIQIKVDRIGRTPRSYKGSSANATFDEIDICCGPLSEKKIENFQKEIESHPDIISSRIVPTDGHLHIFARCNLDKPSEQAKLERDLRSRIREFRD